VDYVTSVGLDRIEAYERNLLSEAMNHLRTVPGLRVIGEAPGKAAVISFLLEGAHPQDLGTLLDRQGVAVRTGHHCAMPLMERYGVTATTRASFAFYNTQKEADAFVQAILKARDILKE
jgi:cysteine desulfurase/selenocysteine lyase